MQAHPFEQQRFRPDGMTIPTSVIFTAAQSPRYKSLLPKLTMPILRVHCEPFNSNTLKIVSVLQNFYCSPTNVCVLWISGYGCRKLNVRSASVHSVWSVRTFRFVSNCSGVSVTGNIVFLLVMNAVDLKSYNEIDAENLSFLQYLPSVSINATLDFLTTHLLAMSSLQSQSFRVNNP